MKTTLNKIKAFEPCDGGWEKLLTFLNKKVADDEELSLLTILESNGLNDALWALIAVEGFEKEIKLMVCDFAESVVHLAKDGRIATAISVSKKYINGIATKKDFDCAWPYSSVSVSDSYVAGFVSDDDWAAMNALDAAVCAYRAAGPPYRASYAYWAAGYAYRAAAAAGFDVSLEQERQKAIFKKHVK